MPIYYCEKQNNKLLFGQGLSIRSASKNNRNGGGRAAADREDLPKLVIFHFSHIREM